MQIFFDIITILFLCIVIAILAIALLSVVFIVLYVIIKVIICDYIIPSIKDYKLKRRIKKQTKNIKEVK